MGEQCCAEALPAACRNVRFFAGLHSSSYLDDGHGQPWIASRGCQGGGFAHSVPTQQLCNIMQHAFALSHKLFDGAQALSLQEHHP